MFLHQNPAGGRDAPVKAGGDKYTAAWNEITTGML